MNLHEYQGKQLFAEYGLPFQRATVDTPEEAVVQQRKLVVLSGLSRLRSMPAVAVKLGVLNYLKIRLK